MLIPEPPVISFKSMFKRFWCN